MLTKLKLSEATPRPATSHILNQPTHETWMRDRLIEAERRGEVVKLTGRRSISSPGEVTR